MLNKMANGYLKELIVFHIYTQRPSKWHLDPIDDAMYVALN